MPDIIHLLPESVANQIAAGEVVQRPASVVKELMENSIDAGATSVRLVIKDAGKMLIQVIDNGKGMSDNDARMSFERHATSKIKKTEDLFHIVTKGFRGEALASIAAVAQVELRTQIHEAQMGTELLIEGSKVKSQEPGKFSAGTNLQVKNLFFNVPARRYFLKSDAIEFRHIVDEFQRVALTHPDIDFSLVNNGTEVFNLPRTQRRQRIVHVFGSKYNEKLVPVEESTDIVSVTGFIGKPDASKKTRGEQFFFVNNRFIRSTYLNHAIMGAFEGLLPHGNFPLYLLYLEIDPEQIDINIHPTKTEIKFQDERAIYAILHASVKRALGRHNIAPSLDFDQEQAFTIPITRHDTEIRQPSLKVNPDYNPFDVAVKKESAIKGWFDQREKASTEGWQDMLQIKNDIQSRSDIESLKQANQNDHSLGEIPHVDEDTHPFQVFRKYILVESNKGLLMIHQQRAHRRILFESYFKQLELGKGSIQQLLFPEEVQLSPAEYALMGGMMDEVKALGFEMSLRENQIVEISGVPADIGASGAAQLIESFIEQFNNEAMLQLDRRSRVAWSMARSCSLRSGQMLTLPEMKDIVARLLQCRQPYFAERKRPIIITMNSTTLDQQFQ